MTAERLHRAAMELRGYNDEIEALEAKLQELADSRRQLERVVLPELMSEAGVKAITLDDGSRVTLSVLAEGALPKDTALRQAALDWLTANGFENLIEAKVTASWTRGDRDKAQAEYERLAALGTAKTSIDETIHPRTLGARIRDRVVAGLPTPLETLGVSVFQRARYTKTANTNNTREPDDQ